MSRRYRLYNNDIIDQLTDEILSPKQVVDKLNRLTRLHDIKQKEINARVKVFNEAIENCKNPEVKLELEKIAKKRFKIE